MTTEDMVDASLAGLDQGEFATIPALPNAADFEHTRRHGSRSLQTFRARIRPLATV